MKPWLTVLLLSSLALAGCTSDPDEAEANGNGEEGQEEILQLDAPTWSVGDYWVFTGSNDAEWTFAVSDDSGSNYVVDTDDEDLAFFHAQFDELGYVGNIDKKTLAGEEDGSAVNYFDWPLQHGKTWTATMDGVAYDMVAHEQSPTKFHIQAMQGDVIVNQYVYNAHHNWFEWFSWGDSEGNEQFRIEIKEFGNDWTGDLVRAEPEIITEDQIRGVSKQTAGVFPDGTFDTEDGDVYLFMSAQCTTGAYQFGIGTFESLVDSNAGTGTFQDQGIMFDSQCPDATQFAGVISESPGDNEDHWGIVIGSESQELELDYTLYLRHFERITL